MTVTPIIWRQGELFIIDQTLLPEECREIRLDSVEAVWEAIRALRVRGAPAIGVCAAFGVLVALNEKRPSTTCDAIETVDEAVGYLETARPLSLIHI